MIIIQDTREKKPWNFTGYEECKGQPVQTVDAGDYILQSHPNLITIDRKSRVAELANNLGMYVERFEREMAKMQRYEHRYVICEFPYDRLLMFPNGAGLPKHIRRKIRVNGKFLAKQVARLSEEYGVEFIFCNGTEEAQQTAMDLFKEILENS